MGRAVTSRSSSKRGDRGNRRISSGRMSPGSFGSTSKRRGSPLRSPPHGSAPLPASPISASSTLASAPVSSPVRSSCFRGLRPRWWNPCRRLPFFRVAMTCLQTALPLVRTHRGCANFPPARVTPGAGRPMSRRQLDVSLSLASESVGGSLARDGKLQFLRLREQLHLEALGQGPRSQWATARRASAAQRPAGNSRR